MEGGVRTGGCLCGAVRYSVRGDPVHVRRCHCADCRKESGSAFTVYAHWPVEAFELNGEISSYDGRGFCPRCGSRLLDTAGPGDALVEIRIGSLDEAPFELKPEDEIWVRRRESWIPPVEQAAQHDESEQPIRPAHSSMSDHDEFVAWVKTTLYEAELALHNGDAAPRRALWSHNEPVSVLGAWRNAHGQRELEELFDALARSFSRCTSYAFELQACDVAGDMAYTAGLEHTTVSVDGEQRTYTLRATQIYRREGGEWKVAHRHGDTVIE